jgi:hypothetical protein
MIRDITKRLVMAMAMDVIPDGNVCALFGMDPEDPNPEFGALQWGWKREAFTEEELDEALGSYSKLNELVNRTSPDGRKNPYPAVF